jgi:hypothetical protein
MPRSKTPSSTQQLDIFADSRNVMLRNDLVGVLTQHDASAASQALARLAADTPDDALLLPARMLLAAMVGEPSASSGGPTAAAHAVDLSAARRHLQSQLVPAAAAVLGRDNAQAWLAPLWRDLARRSEPLPWTAALADDHAAPLWLAAGDWAQAARAAGAIASWRRIPAPLAWMAEARFRLDGVDAVWPLLTELAWLAPRRLDGLLRRLADPLLDRLRRRFDDGFDAGVEHPDEHGDLAWFPAWVLTDTPALAQRLALAEPGQDGAAERGLRLLVSLLGLERQGRHPELVARRLVLRDLSAPLYSAYIATR